MSTDFHTWTVGETLRASASRFGSRVFLRVMDGGSFSFEDIHQRALRVAGALQAAGVARGDVVCSMLRNGVEAVQTWFGANLLGAMEAPLNTGYRGASLVHALNQAQARYLVIDQGYLPLLTEIARDLRHLKTIWVVASAEPVGGLASMQLIDLQQSMDGANGAPSLPELKASDIASVIYTSGTTGPAKGVMMPHGQVVLLARQTAAKLGIRPDDVYYSFHPLYHMAGKFMQVLACLHAGATLVLDSAFSAPDWLARVRDAGATLSGAHGPMLEMIHAQPPTTRDRDHALRAICTAPFPKHIASAFEQRFGVRGLEVWGMTEVGIPLWCSLDEPLREGSCGKVDAEWYEFAVLDPDTDDILPAGEVGQFAVRPRRPWVLMQGYLGMPEKTVDAWRNLWFHTGDLGWIDESGYAYFADRASDRIRRRAENVSGYDIEVAALAHPDVAEVATVGVPSEFASDDDIKLCAVLRPGASLLPGELLQHLAKRLPHYMVPRYIEMLDELPRSATHKVQRAQLRYGPQAHSGVWDRRAHGVVLREVMEQQ